MLKKWRKSWLCWFCETMNLMQTDKWTFAKLNPRFLYYILSWKTDKNGIRGNSAQFVSFRMPAAHRSHCCPQQCSKARLGRSLPHGVTKLLGTASMDGPRMPSTSATSWKHSLVAHVTLQLCKWKSLPSLSLPLIDPLGDKKIGQLESCKWSRDQNNWPSEPDKANKP